MRFKTQLIQLKCLKLCTAKRKTLFTIFHVMRKLMRSGIRISFYVKTFELNVKHFSYILSFRSNIRGSKRSFVF